MRIKKIRYLAIIGFICALGMGYAIAAVNIYFYGNNYKHIQADVAIVLGAEVWGNEPSPVFRERINHAISLYKNQNIRIIIFTGGVGVGKELSEAEVGKLYAMKNGVKENDILIETKSRTTRQNLINAREIIDSKQFSKILIVSDPLHMKRAVLMARDLGINAYPSPTLTTRYRTVESQFQFLLRETYFYLIYLIFKM
jgi:uncharacterized SAM-binding protein YcdF (DUF218 family)